MRCFLLLTILLIACCISDAQENPAPMPPNYELIKKETGRWFGEYRYKKLIRCFDHCDTSMTVDHFRCLYYGAVLRADTAYTLVNIDNQYRILADSLGTWHPSVQQAWWRLQMLTAAVWSSGNGSEEYPFHVACPDDERYMLRECSDMMEEVYVIVDLR